VPNDLLTFLGAHLVSRTRKTASSTVHWYLCCYDLIIDQYVYYYYPQAYSQSSNHSSVMFPRQHPKCYQTVDDIGNAAAAAAAAAAASILFTTGHQLQTVQMTTENISACN